MCLSTGSGGDNLWFSAGTTTVLLVWTLAVVERGTRGQRLLHVR